MKINITGKTYNMNVEEAFKFGVLTPVRRIGQCYQVLTKNGEHIGVYVLASVGKNISENKISTALISITNGNLWANVFPVSDVLDITENEWQAICDQTNDACIFNLVHLDYKINP